MVRLRRAALLALPLAWAPAHAQHDTQLWTAAVATGPVRGELALFLYAEARFGEDLSRHSQTLLGAGLGWEPNERFSAYGGYLLIATRRPGAGALREHRFWQQAGYQLGTVGPFRLSGRTMVEQRSFEGARDIGWRLQQHLRAALPVAGRGRTRLIAYGEILLNLDDTDWGARSGWDQWRAFAGIDLPIGRSQILEMGYFHQRILTAGGPDRTNHVAQIIFLHRFGG